MTMKKLFTLFAMTMLVCITYAQPPIKCLFLVDALPFASGDDKNNQILNDKLEEYGFSVTPEAISATSATEGYDIIVISEAITSDNSHWHRYQTAPTPIVMTKVWSIKDGALSWIDNALSETNFGNLPDTAIVVQDPKHDILTGFSDEDTIKIGDNVGTSDANVCFTKIPAAAGLKVVATCQSDDTKQAITAMDPGTVLNGISLVKRACIVPWHQVFWDEVNDDGWKILENACYWAAGRKPPVDETFVVDNSMVEASIYPNPSSGFINLRFAQSVADLSVNVMSIDGKVLYSTKLSDTQSEVLDLSFLNSGIYFIRCDGDFSFTKKISLYK